MRVALITDNGNPLAAPEDAYPADPESKESRFLVFFKLVKERPLVGNG